MWPISRKNNPKQFSVKIENKTLFQLSALRLTSSNELELEPQTILTNDSFRFMVKEQLREVGIDLADIIVEPMSKNTAPAILAACLSVVSKDPEALLLVAPCDHVIPDVTEFHNAIKLGIKYAKTGKTVTFGVKPTNPETGYGYLELAIDKLDEFGTCSVEQFIEKPTLQSYQNVSN